MKKKSMTFKKTGKQIQDNVRAGADIVKEETGEVMRRVKKAASEANRKGKAAIQAIKS